MEEKYENILRSHIFTATRVDAVENCGKLIRIYRQLGEFYTPGITLHIMFSDAVSISKKRAV